MPARLPNISKSMVIQQWLQGIPRDAIANNNGLSAGAVTNIINEWRQQLGFSLVDELRELAITLKRIGISPAQCAVGCRIAMIMLNLGVKEDSLEQFILDVYNRCKDLALSPENIASHLEDLLEFSKTSVPLLQIPDYIKQKTDEKRKLQEEIENLKGQIQKIGLEKLDLEANRDVALQQEKMTATELKWYLDLKNELKKYKIPVEDVAEFAKVVNGIKQQGYDLGKVIMEFSDIDSSETRHKMLLDSMQMLESKCTDLKQESSILENAVNFHKQTMTKYNELEAIGFGLKELKALWYTINEVAIANNISMKEAPRKFFKDIEEQYDNKLGFESKVESLRLEVNRLSHELSGIRAGLLAQPLVGSALIRLIQSGVKEQDIINIANIFESHSETINPQLLIAELKEYGNIKSNIQKLRNQVDSLQTQKQDLDVYNNQSIVSTYMYSKQSIYFYSRVIDLLKNEIIGLFSALIVIKNYYLPNLHLENLKKSNDLGPVIPLIRAAKGESVSILELKASVIKAIEIMINKLNTNDGVAKILSEARFALEKKQ
jgi:hypothetical protein